MNITSATEARKLCDELLLELRQLPHNADLKKYLRNLDAMVSDLSRKEVIARRTRSTHIIQEPLADLNKSLNHLRNLILMARLME